MPNERRVLYLNPRDLLPSRENVRSDPGDLAGLAETIREHGILQPLGVQRDGDTYRIVYGNRRRDAAIVVGLDRVPCLELDDIRQEDVMVQQVLENLQRLDLNDADKSRAFKELLARMTAGGMTQGEAMDEMARTLGLSVRQIQRYLRLTQLAPGVQRLIAEGELGVTHAQHLVDITPSERQEAIANLVVEESLSAAELSRLCSALQRNINIDPRVALEAMRRGERIPVVENKPEGTITRLTPTPMPKDTDGAAGDAPWDEDDPQEEGARPNAQQATPQDAEFARFERLEPTTRDGNRVRKLHSLDSFMDELDRLARCVQEGDLQRFADEDEAAPVKVRMAIRQLRFLMEALSPLAQTLGPND